MVGVEIPEEFPSMGCKGTVECFLYRVIVMDINLRRDPHAKAVASDFFVARCECGTGKDYDLVLVICIRPIDDQAFIAFVLAPFALPREDVFQSETIAVTDIQLCIRTSRTGGEVHLIRMRLQFMGESIHIVYSLAGTNSAFRYVIHVVHALSDVSLMLLAPLVPERRYPSDFFLFLATPELPAFSTFPHRHHRPLRKASRLSHSGLQGSRWNRVSCS